MLCPKCGHENPPEAKFCGRCAEPLSGGPPAPPPQPTVGTKPSSELNVWLIVASVLVPLLGIILGVVYMNDANPQKKAAGKIYLYVGIGVLALSCLCGFIMGMAQQGMNY